MSYEDVEQDYDQQIDLFSDGSKEVSRDELSSAFTQFGQGYQKNIQEVEELLDQVLDKRWDGLHDPADLWVAPYEQIQIWEIAAKGDIQILNKIFMVFGSLCKEIAFLKTEAEERFIPAFIAYGLFDEADEGLVQQQIAKMVHVLCDLENFVARSFTVLQNCVVQLAAVYSAQSELYRTTFRMVHLQTVFENIGKLLVALVTIDRIIEGNDTFHDHWAQYKRMTEDVKKNPGHFGVEPDQVFRLQKLLLHLEGRLLSQAIFYDAVHQDFELDGLVQVRGNAAFQKEFGAVIGQMQSELLQKLPKGDSLTNQRRFMSLCTLVGLFVNVFGAPVDSRLFASLWDVHKVIPIVALAGRGWWWPTEFLETHCGLCVGSLKPKARQEVAKVRQDILKARDAGLKARLHTLHARAAVWMSRMESNLASSLPVQAVIIERIALLRDGLDLANAIAAELRVLSALHVASQRPWAPDHVALLCKAAALLKAIQNTFHRRSAMMGETINAMIDQVRGALTLQFSRLKADVQSGRRQDDRKLDVLAALNFALTVVAGPASADRRILLRLAMHVFLRGDIAKAQELVLINDNMSTLEVVCNIQEFIRSACDGSVLFWIRSIVPPYFASVYAKPELAHRLQYILSSLADALPVLKKAAHVDGDVLCARFSDELEGMVRETVLEPCARDIDVELRFHAHAHLGVAKDRDPFRTGVKHLVALTRLSPLIFHDRTIDIKSFVEHHLERLYYDEVAVTQHKWRGFEEQRNLARQKYGLTLTESLLPGQTLDNDLDVLQIMRMIHVFVRNYHYNLNNQIFIQHDSEGKNLNSINVDVIADSIRTHGIGIMNTTVNFTFQFLKQRFIMFSQFLYDDHIAARLYKDSRFFKKERMALNNRYPFDRAEKFHKEIRKLGMEKGLSYLDKFRMLVTEIGNAMGYIRMIRTAGHHYISSAIKFVPDLSDIPVFEQSATEAQLSEETRKAARILDDTIGNLSEHFSVGTEYFVTLVNVFAKEFRDPKNKHLRYFYMICPPLIVNYVEHMVMARDRVGKKGRAGENAVWTDDGLPLGIAYILKLLDQESAHDSLHFFESAIQHFQSAIDRLRHEIAGLHKRRQAEDIQAKQATLARLEKYHKELLACSYSFVGSKTFFLFADEALKDVAKPEEAQQQQQAAGEQTGTAPAAPAEGQPTANGASEEDESVYESEVGKDYF